MIEDNGPRSGLTDRVERFLLATTPTAAGAEESGVRVVPHDEGPVADAGATPDDEPDTGSEAPDDDE